jgi:chemotaxis protein methyltransferase CheR
VPITTISDEDYNEFRAFLERTSGIVLGDAKQYLVRGRLQRLLDEKGLTSLAGLNAALRTETSLELRTRVIDAMTTNETSWFRDEHPYDYLFHVVLPELKREGSGRLRIWSAGCSTGEEPYSIGIVVQEFLTANPRCFSSVEIVATDISAGIIGQASAGLFEAASLSRGLAVARRDKYFTPADTRWAIKPEVRKLVRFSRHSLLHDFTPLGMFDVVFCRNVLFYFSRPRRTDIVTRLVNTIKSHGFFILGSAETIDHDTLPLVRSKRAPAGMVYRRQDSVVGVIP